MKKNVFWLCLGLMLSFSPSDVFAEVSKSSAIQKRPKRTWDVHRDAEYIFICSDFSDVNARRLKRFFNNIFPDKKPAIIDGYQNVPDSDAAKLVLFAARKEPSKAVLECLNKFSVLSEEKKKKSLEQTRQIGEKPFWTNEVRMAKYYAPVKTVITISEVQSWSFLYFFR
jgi:hypothetical protein